jgi:hypothetical protein
MFLSLFLLLYLSMYNVHLFITFLYKRLVALNIRGFDVIVQSATCGYVRYDSRLSDMVCTDFPFPNVFICIYK